MFNDQIQGVTMIMLFFFLLANLCKANNPDNDSLYQDFLTQKAILKSLGEKISDQQKVIFSIQDLLTTLKRQYLEAYEENIRTNLNENNKVQESVLLFSSRIDNEIQQFLREFYENLTKNGTPVLHTLLAEDLKNFKNYYAIYKFNFLRLLYEQEALVDLISQWESNVLKFSFLENKLKEANNE